MSERKASNDCVSGEASGETGVSATKPKALWLIRQATAMMFTTSRLHADFAVPELKRFCIMRATKLAAKDAKGAKEIQENIRASACFAYFAV